MTDQDITIAMTDAERALFEKLLSSATSYLEFGSGGSTILASRTPTLNRATCVESSNEYFNDQVLPDPDVQKAVESKKLEVMLVDIGPTADWGFPVDKSSRKKWVNYAESPFRNDSSYDLVLVDGRFRVACALQALFHATPDTIIAFHDYWNRHQYHVVEQFFELVERVDNFAIFKAKSGYSKFKARMVYGMYRREPGDHPLYLKIRRRLSRGAQKD